ncbi:MAG: neutral zinc metallopeptidase [Gemmatimonadaceae bacterium]|nr:neutral zinc metallopeptidase [Gemmatimonadaceae bacterium]
MEDRRGDSVGRGGGGGLSLGGGRLGIGGIVLVLIVSALFGVDPRTLLNGGGGTGAVVPATRAPAGPVQESAAERELVGQQSWVIRHAQDFWTRTFTDANRPYARATLVLFRDAVDSGCGFAESAMGPFYCPRDRKVYIDLGFYDELARRFGAPGDFAQAYVLAHEVGHHVQNLLGTERELRRAQQADPSQANALSVRMELQADCYAGIWGRQAAQEGRLDAGDLEEALRAAAAVGDDRIQSQARGEVRPERFTHGSAEQRMRWFRRGFDTGDMNACDSFAAR